MIYINILRITLGITLCYSVVYFSFTVFHGVEHSVSQFMFLNYSPGYTVHNSVLLCDPNSVDLTFSK